MSSLYGITCLLCGPGQLMTQGVQWPPGAPVTPRVTPSALNPHYCEEKQFPLFPLQSLPGASVTKDRLTRKKQTAVDWHLFPMDPGKNCLLSRSDLQGSLSLTPKFVEIREKERLREAGAGWKECRKQGRFCLSEAPAQNSHCAGGAYLRLAGSDP